MIEHTGERGKAGDCKQTVRKTEQESREKDQTCRRKKEQRKQ